MEGSELQISRTTVQGMMMGEWEQGTKKEVAENFVAVCLNGEVWEIQVEGSQKPVGTINPTVATSERDVKQVLCNCIEGRVRAESVQKLD